MAEDASARHESGGSANNEQIVSLAGEASRSSQRAERSAFAEGYGGQPPRGMGAEAGEPPRNRTENPQIKSLLLCQLS
jgi:hypothetical protein